MTKGVPAKQFYTETNTAAPMNNPLTKRELEVLMLTMEGLVSKEVAERLCISTRTVETHCSNIFEKLQVHNKTAAIYKARLLNILQELPV